MKEKAKRPDVRERLLERKNVSNTVVKTTLNSRLCPKWSVDGKMVFQNELNKWIKSTSEIVYRGGLIWNRLLLHCLTYHKELPPIDQSLFTGIFLSKLKVLNKKSSGSQLIDDFVESEFYDYPKITRQRGDCQAIAIAAKKYLTAFNNSLIYPFKNRQKNFVYKWCDKNNVVEEHRYLVLFAINGWNSKKESQKIPSSPPVLNFIKSQRDILGNPTNLTETYLKKNSIRVLNYYYQINQYYTKIQEGNKFTLAPVSKLKLHSLGIDNTVLYEMLQNVIKKHPTLVPEQIKTDVSSGSVNIHTWRSIFDFTGLRENRKFDNQVETDSVSASFYFKYNKKWVQQAKKRKNKKRRQKESRVIAIDPGRTNIIYGVDMSSNKTYKLTRKQYYRETGMTKRFKHVQHCMLPIQPIHKKLTQIPIRSISDKNWYEYQQTITRHYEKLWAVKSRKTLLRYDFRVYTLKQKALDRFLSSFQVEGELRPIIAYGGARMNPTGKGELSVPVKYVFDRCRNKYETQIEDESFSTAMHHECQKRTSSVMDGESRRTIRGLRWCETCRKLVHRDRNACFNIAASFAATTRPKYLTRASKATQERPKTHVLPRGSLVKRYDAGSGVPTVSAITMGFRDGGLQVGVKS